VAACPWVVCVVTTRAGRQGSVTEAHGSVSGREREVEQVPKLAGGRVHAQTCSGWRARQQQERCRSPRMLPRKRGDKGGLG
jgi:hypothetical protein